jgi:hypothetical protein
VSVGRKEDLGGNRITASGCGIWWILQIVGRIKMKYELEGVRGDEMLKVLRRWETISTEICLEFHLLAEGMLFNLFHSNQPLRYPILPSTR